MNWGRGWCVYVCEVGVCEVGVCEGRGVGSCLRRNDGEGRRNDGMGGAGVTEGGAGVAGGGRKCGQGLVVGAGEALGGGV